MKEAFIIEKIQDGTITYLNAEHKSIYWVDDINKALRFDNEEECYNVLLYNVRVDGLAAFAFKTYWFKN